MFSRALALVLLVAIAIPATANAQSKTDKKLLNTMTKSKEQLRTVELGLMALDKALAGSSSAVTAADRAHYQWLLDVRGRISSQHAYLREAVRDAEHVKSGAATKATLIEQIEERSEQFAALRKSVQMESRKFQTLSNASKARHEAAMNAIRNMKG